jgi:hypothetical protein
MAVRLGDESRMAQRRGTTVTKARGHNPNGGNASAKPIPEASDAPSRRMSDGRW